MPAAYFWNPGPGSDFESTTPGNWMMGTSIPYAYHTEAPNHDDDLIFQGGVTDANCTIRPPTNPPEATQTFNSIQLIFGLNTVNPPVGEDPPPPPMYWGTVTTEGSYTVSDLTVQCGYIYQDDPNAPTGNSGTLTVTSELVWNGGTLNKNTVPGNIDLAPGATGIAEPSTYAPINETVYLGSALNLKGDEATQTGSTLTLKNGVYMLVGGFFRAMAPSILTLAPVPKVPPPSTPGTPSITLDNEKVTNPTVLVEPNSTLKVATVGRVNNTDKVDVKVSGGGVQIHNQGTVDIEEYTRLIMAKKPGANFAEYLQNRAILFDPPVTNLQAGSEIKFEDNGDFNKGCFNLTEGELVVTGVPGLSDAQQPVAAITAPANPTAPALFVGVDGKVTFHPCYALTLAITGDFTCEGEMYLLASRSTNTNDKITATGFMKYQTGQGAGLRTAKLYVEWWPMSGNLPAGDTEWELLAVVGNGGGIVTDPIPTIPTDVNAPDTLTPGRLPAPKTYGMTFDKK